MKNNKVSSSKGIIMNKKVLKDLENLYKRMDTTSKTRFAASRSSSPVTSLNPK